MIRNFLLDMGNVLLKWDPEYILDQYTKDETQRQYLLTGLVQSPDWGRLDAGEIDHHEILRRAKGRMPEWMHPLLTDVNETWPKHMPELPGAAEFVRDIHAQGMGAYLLSNAGTRFPDCVMDRPVMQMLDGYLVSAHEKVAKPNAAIYRRALEKFGLKADECLFLDDMPENVAGAKACGIQALVFDGDYAALRQTLARMGVRIS